MSSMALLSILLAGFLGSTGPESSPGRVVGIGPASTPVVCAGTVLGIGSEEEDEQVDLRKLDQIPKVWIGVRVSSVPDPLAAHLKRGTLMIVNVAEDSPADQAGIDRYDVVLSVNDREITEMQDLLEAIGENGADRPARMVVIKGGEERTLTVTPIQRDPAVAPTFKYEEQEVAEVDPLKKYFGHRVKLGPDGNLLVIPHGRLDGLPDDIKSLLDEIPDMSRDYMFDDLPFGFIIEIDDGDETITIQRDKDGKFTVEREDGEGNRTSDTYDDVDQLREGDEEAYKIYRRSALQRGHSTIVLPPDFNDLGHWQQDFEIELKAKLDQAQKQDKQAVKDAQRRVEIHRRKTDADRRSDTTTHTKTTTLSISDGRITLTITENGVTRKYEFDSREQFEASEPVLYQQYESYLD